MNSSLTQVSFSFGTSQYDVSPATVSGDWHEWGAWLDENRAPKKRSWYITSQFGGDGKRSLENALPRNWLPFDCDGNLSDSETLTLFKWFYTHWQALGYETSSSSENARRARFIILCDRPITDREARHLGPIIAANAPVKPSWVHPETGVIKPTWDVSVFRASQPLFLPTAGKRIWTFTKGDPLDVDQTLSDFPYPKPKVYRPPNRYLRVDAPDLYQFFKANGLVLKEGASGVDVICPWANSHSPLRAGGPPDTTGSVFFPPSAANGYVGGFVCQHSSCRGRHIGAIFKLIKGRE